MKVQNLARIIISLRLRELYEGKEMTATQLQACQKHLTAFLSIKMQKINNSRYLERFLISHRL